LGQSRRNPITEDWMARKREEGKETMPIAKEHFGLSADKDNLHPAKRAHAGIAANPFAADHPVMAAASCLLSPVKREMS
jgi:hypothetical protein